MTNAVQTIYGTLDAQKLKVLKDAVDEALLVMHEMEQKKTILKDIIDITFDKTRVPKKIISRIIKVKHKQNMAEEVAEFKEFEAIVESITK